jgi:hypothetical protein
VRAASKRSTTAPTLESGVTSVFPTPSADLLQRMVDAVELVRQRLVRAATALGGAGVQYAVAGGNAVAAWVATVDRAGVRNTQDVERPLL